MNRSVVVALLLIVIAAGGGYWWWSQSQDTTVDDGPETAVDYRDPTPAEPTAREPEPPEYPVSDLSSDGVDAEVAQGEASSGDEAAEAGPAPLPPLARQEPLRFGSPNALTPWPPTSRHTCLLIPYAAELNPHARCRARHFEGDPNAHRSSAQYLGI